MNIIVENINVTELIPQRPPFVMIDCLSHIDHIVATSKFEVRNDNLFVEDDRLTAPGMIENVAQTCAARIGYMNKVSNAPIKLGFIGAIRNLQIRRTARIGEVLYTTITVKEEIFQMTLVDAEMKSGNETILTAEMKIALSDINA